MISKILSVAVAVVALVCLTSVNADVPAALCDCWEGSRTSTAPCTCACPSGSDFVTPFCAFKSTDTGIKIAIVTNSTNDAAGKGNFSASRLEAKLSAHYQDTQATILYRRIVDETQAITRYYPDNIVVMFVFNAGFGKQFLDSVIAQEAWTIRLGIIDANMFSPDLGVAQGIQGAKLFDFTASEYLIHVHIWDIIWVILLIFPVCFIICCECCCCTTNTQEKAERMEGEKKNAPFDGAVIQVDQMESSLGKESQTFASPTAKSAAPEPNQDEGATLAVAGAGAAGAMTDSQRRSTMRKSVGDVDAPRPPRGRAKRPGKGRGLEPDVTVTDLTFDEESGLWWSQKEYLFFNKKSQMWYDPESTYWFDPADNKWFEFSEDDKKN